MDPRYIIYKPEEYNRQMNEVVSSRCKRNERAKRAHSLYIYIDIEKISIGHTSVGLASARPKYLWYIPYRYRYRVRVRSVER